VMRAAGDGPDGIRLRGPIVVLWRAGLRISEALALAETDLDRIGGRPRFAPPLVGSHASSSSSGQAVGSQDGAVRRFGGV